ncbi:MAG: Pr6Pr family membrane protein [Rhizobiaceae bacterium]|nr:Pr6Pr family membrane protein [Rhizobiaceae bacterium]
MSRTLQTIGVLLGVSAVIIQFWLAIGRFTVEGLSVAASVVRFFAFFTILTNIFVVLVHAAGLFAGRFAFFRRPLVVRSALVAIAIVGIVYHLLLAQLWNPQGLQYVTDIMLHYAAPVLMIVWWIAYGRTGDARWRDIPLMLAYPIVYVCYIFVRAPLAGEVPYPFLDYLENGWPHVLQMIAAILALFVAVSALAVAADRFLPAAKKSAS